MTKKQMLEQHKTHLRMISKYAVNIAEHGVDIAEYKVDIAGNEVKLAEAKLLLVKDTQILEEKEEYIEEVEKQLFDLTVEFDEYKRTYPANGTPKAKASKPREKDPLNKYDCEEGERVANLFDGNDCDIFDKEEEGEANSLFAKS